MVVVTDAVLVPVEPGGQGGDGGGGGLGGGGGGFGGDGGDGGGLGGDGGGGGFGGGGFGGGELTEETEPASAKAKKQPSSAAWRLFFAQRDPAVWLRCMGHTWAAQAAREGRFDPYPVTWHSESAPADASHASHHHM